MRARFDALAVLVQPAMGRRDELSPWHLNVDQHRVVRGIKLKTPDECQQSVIGFR